MPICRHRGSEFAPGRWPCSSPRLVVPKGVTADLCRSVCPYVDHGVDPVRPDSLLPPVLKASAPIQSTPLGSGYGVAIGTYDSLHTPQKRYGTEAVELNLAVIRANCGSDVRILVCDDASPPASQEHYRKTCDRYGAEFSTNDRRMGHTSGDMIVFHKAIRWASELGLRTVTKLSHRMLIDIPNWVQDDSERLIISGFATQTQMLANFGIEQVRTECVMMIVSRWETSEVMHHFRPRSIPYWNESHAFLAISRMIDPHMPYPHFLPWHRLSYFRGNDCAPCYFRDMSGDGEREFHLLARRYGVKLTDNFSIVDSCQSLDYL
ncbi:MAG TPA: hypothetical protein PLR25_12515 [Planctomycetaceae bacterium]|nr:hypothetical protein [Planctomycetaceae bacterium]